MTDCGQKCFELQDTEYSLAVEKENNQKLEAEVKNLKDQIERLEADSASKDECIYNLQYDLKDAGGELELWQKENAELKKQNALLYEQEKEKIKLIEKMKNCLNCAHGQKPVSKEKILFCCSCRGLDEQKENIIYKDWKLAK